MFFSNLKMKNQKWTKKNVHFQKSQNTFEKTLHHSLFVELSLSIFGDIYICKGLKGAMGGLGSGRARDIMKNSHP
jgi:hypothetical protein